MNCFRSLSERFILFHCVRSAPGKAWRGRFGTDFERFYNLPKNMMIDRLFSVFLTNIDQIYIVFIMFHSAQSGGNNRHQRGTLRRVAGETLPGRHFDRDQLHSVVGLRLRLPLRATCTRAAAIREDDHARDWTQKRADLLDHHDDGFPA